MPGTGFLAGAAVFLDACIGHVLNLGLADVPVAVAMAAERPRELLGLPVPRIESGQAADFVVFNWQPGGELRVISQCKTG
jgi:N-acetylglucosamine-6-phosphate deacetylase